MPQEAGPLLGIIIGVVVVTLFFAFYVGGGWLLGQTLRLDRWHQRRRSERSTAR